MKFPRSARIFRGHLDIAPFASVFFLLMIFALLGALIEHLLAGTRLAIASGLTLPGGRCETRPVQAWRAAPAVPLGSRLPTVFCWLAS